MAMTLDAIDPTSCPTGPPSAVDITLTGSGFTTTSVIRFGSVLEQDWTDQGKAYVSDTELTLEITAGLFPDPDANVPVSVYDPDTQEETPALTFAFVGDPVPPDPGPGPDPEPGPPDEVTIDDHLAMHGAGILAGKAVGWP